MKRRLFLVSALTFSLVAWAGLSKEVLVLSTSTLIPRTVDTKGLEIMNLGPNTIWCGFGSSAAAVINKSRPIVTNEAWSIDISANVPIYCISSVSQVTGAATVVTEATR